MVWMIGRRKNCISVAHWVSMPLLNITAHCPRYGSPGWERRKNSISVAPRLSAPLLNLAAYCPRLAPRRWHQAGSTLHVTME